MTVSRKWRCDPWRPSIEEKQFVCAAPTTGSDRCSVLSELRRRTADGDEKFTIHSLARVADFKQYYSVLHHLSRWDRRAACFRPTALEEMTNVMHQ